MIGPTRDKEKLKKQIEEKKESSVKKEQEPLKPEELNIKISQESEKGWLIFWIVITAIAILLGLISLNKINNATKIAKNGTKTTSHQAKYDTNRKINTQLSLGKTETIKKYQVKTQYQRNTQIQRNTQFQKKRWEPKNPKDWFYMRTEKEECWYNKIRWKRKCNRVKTF